MPASGNTPTKRRIFPAAMNAGLGGGTARGGSTPPPGFRKTLPTVRAPLLVASEGSSPVKSAPPLALVESFSRPTSAGFFCCFRGTDHLKANDHWRKQPPEMPKAPTFQGDLQNVDSALTSFRAVYTQVFLSDSNHLERLGILVAGVGFEPTTFRL